MEILEIAGRSFFSTGPAFKTPAPLFLGFGLRQAAFEELWQRLQKRYQKLPFFCLALCPEKTDDFSPWPWGEFPGEGDRLLSFIETKLLPQLKERYPISSVYLFGYSLAGLFALYGFCKSEAVNGAASMSGSLWYPDWTGFLASCCLPHKKAVCLSLGDTENKGNDPLFSTVLFATEKTAALLKEKLGEERVRFEMNSGGHHVQVPYRIEKGIAALYKMEKSFR